MAIKRKTPTLTNGDLALPTAPGTYADRVNEEVTGLWKFLNEVVNVKHADFDGGAAADGITDDSDAIQAAIDYAYSAGGGTVFMPVGNYVAQGLIVYPEVYLLGAGSGATRIYSPAVPDVGVPIIKGSPDNASVFEFGGAAGFSIYGPGTSDESSGATPGNGNNDLTTGVTVDGISFQDLDSEGAGYRLYEWHINDIYITQCRYGIYLSKNVYSVTVENSRILHCAVGTYIYSQHPNIINTDYRWCDKCLDGGDASLALVIDWAVTQCRFSLSRIGIDAQLQRCGVVNCTFYQNQELGLRLGSQNHVVGCLFKGPVGDSPTPIANNTCIRVEGRQNIIGNCTFFGDNDAGAITLAANNTTVFPGTVISNNFFYVNHGPAIEKIDPAAGVSNAEEPGVMPMVAITDNYFLVQLTNEVGISPSVIYLQYADGKGLVLDVPSTRNQFNNFTFAGNTVRVDGNGLTGNITTALINVQVTTSGYNLTNNTLQAVGGITTQGISCSDSTDAVVVGNRFIAASPNAINNKFLPGTTTRLICHSNAGLRTRAKGFQAFASGDTLKTVTHGMDFTPAAHDFMVTPITDPRNSTKWWADNPTATTIDLHVSPSPGTGSITLAFQADDRFSGQT